MSIHKDEHGFMRSSGYGKVDLNTLRSELNIGPDEAIYHTSNRNGVRSSNQVKESNVTFKPGDTFNAGPQVVKASLFNRLFGTETRASQQPPPRQQNNQQQNQNRKNDSHANKTHLFNEEIRGLKKAGFGAVPAPELTQWGWSIRLKGFTLPGGGRTDAMILLPKNYPLASPIGFYLKKGANTGGLDQSHLYANAYHGAVNLSSYGWQWFCGIAEGWKPGRHNLVSYLSMVLTMLAEGGN